MASNDWADPWTCGACTYQHVEPAEARLASCSICGTRRAVVVGPSAFLGCTSLSEIALPPNLTEIGAAAFRKCTSLSEIALPPNLIEIGQYAFSDCTSLTEVTLPVGPVYFGHAAFEGCPGVLELPPNEDHFSMQYAVRSTKRFLPKMGWI